jgi:hypothetical protein
MAWPLPEHRDDEGGEQRRVEAREQRLDVIHHVVVVGRDESRADGDPMPATVAMRPKRM